MGNMIQKEEEAQKEGEGAAGGYGSIASLWLL